MESAIDWHTAKALLDWHVELGATEAIGDVPVNRYELPASKPKATAATSPVRAEEPGPCPWPLRCRRSTR